MKKILVIEDSLSQGEVIRHEFEEHNYDVLVATTGFEAFRALRENLFDLIILDYLLPDTNGIELCQRIKQDYLQAKTPIIMFSSQNRLNYMVQAYEAGADYYVVKDIEGSRILLLLADSFFTRRGGYHRKSKSA